ncbi:MAG: ATP-binding cassette domain-containing protein [Spirochaetes bacterium]|nr:ATP-binding cassette domain-containing protein [Spirochaetota bacterium]
MSINISLKKKLPFYTIDISFSCPDGKMLVMVGPSGGGKTTIIRMLAGLEKPDEGEIFFRDRPWFDSRSDINIPVQKRRLGYVFQDYTLFPHLNLYENAAFAAVDKNEVDELFELFSINHLRKQKPDRVSGGERQRCAICQALARHPRVLLLDEPFSALDVITRRDLRDELKNLKGRYPFPMIYVTHDINEAYFLADQILPIVEGKVVSEWMKRTVACDTTLRAARKPRLAIAY